ncbi:MAG: hypothetical protein KUG77_02045 [Nannocystaceae bacterium]|nr:hypothetical protein [Nannocystaceae bacterium]
MPYSFDDARWPLAVFRIEDSLTAAEEVEFSECSTRLPERELRYAVIVDLAKAGTPSPRFMRLQAKAQKLRYAGIQTHCAGIAFVIRSPMIRGALRAILHLQSLPCPQVVVASIEDAQTWTAEKMQDPT